jgi:ATP-dependent DNA helicase RecQ
MHQLLDQDLLQRSSGDRPVVMLNTKSWEVLRGEREVILLQPSSTQTKASKNASDDWSGVDRDLFERLRVWRRQIALSRNKPAWTIFDDKSLRSIASQKPQTPADLLQCKGIGEKRLADFGAAILNIVNEKNQM